MADGSQFICKRFNMSLIFFLSTESKPNAFESNFVDLPGHEPNSKSHSLTRAATSDLQKP